MSMTRDDDVVSYLTRYPQEVTFGDEEAADVFDRYHTADFVMINDGMTLNRRSLIDHVRSARKRVAAVEVQVHDAHVSGGRVAARYTLTAAMRKGTTIATEIYAFGQLAPDGRLARVEQVTRTPEG